MGCHCLLRQTAMVTDKFRDVFEVLSSLHSSALHTTLILIDGPSLVAQMVKILPPMQETQVSSLYQENPLEKRMATYSSIHA